MILVFGGTTEGRVAVKTLDEGEGSYIYSTVGAAQEVKCAHGVHITGEMNETEMEKVCRNNNVELIVDAAHPFAITLHNTLARVALRLGLPVIRFERIYPSLQNSGIKWCENYEDAVKKMGEAGVKKLLALTGVQTIPKLKGFWGRHETWFRVLDRAESVEKAKRFGFPQDHLVFYQKDDTSELIKRFNPDAIITKESGVSGGFEEKFNAAVQKDVNFYVIRRPRLPDSFITVDGRHGLRREVERRMPDFYQLHTGFTTGSCATAAAKAALWGLLTGEKLSTVSFRIPEGETMRMNIASVEIGPASSSATVIKDAGDDPDVTDKCHITATVSLAERKGLRFKGGAGVGKVTLPGLGLPVGDPAINPIPRTMIAHELSSLYSGGLDVTLSIENGEILATKTFNPRVGVVGGVSIIGTTGIVRPFSHEAFVDAIRREMEVAIAIGSQRIVVNSGGRSERTMRGLYPGLPAQAFIHYGNAVGDTMRLANELNVPMLTIGLMIGKAVKLAEGNLNTHSHIITLNRDFLCNIAKKSGCSEHAQDAISKMNMARELWTGLSREDSDRFFLSVLKLCRVHCCDIYHGKLEAVLIDDENNIRFII